MYVEGFYNNVPSFRNNFLEYHFEPNYVGNILSGLKWQCIEFVRRYFIEKYHITFKSVKNVYDMLNLNSFIIISNRIEIPLYFYTIKNKVEPKVDDMVLFYYKDTGHIALISSVKGDVIEICEQNWDRPWVNDKYSRRISIYDPSILGFLRI